jgi:2,3-bisphosphoglycerate-independent phosphoglycerate mutase
MATKYVILLGDGMADHPQKSLGGMTPLQAARIPNMDRMAKEGCSGLAKTVPDGMPPGSDVANLSVLGYDPRRYYSGRAPLEASAMGVSLSKDDIAFRCNYVTVEDGRMLDYSAGHITSEEGSAIVPSIRHLVPEGRLYAGVSYRNLMVLKGGGLAQTTPPHDILDQEVKEHFPKGVGSELLQKIMDDAAPILKSHSVNQARIAAGKRPANMIWLWGQGPAPFMPSFRSQHGIDGAMISAVDLLKGIGRCAGMEIAEVPGANGTIDTDYQGKVDAAFDALSRVDLVYLHVEAPDEAGHSGDAALKVRAIELFDELVVGPVLRGLSKADYSCKVIVLPDHPTPLEIRTHTGDLVPFTVFGDGLENDGVRGFDEEQAKGGGFGVVVGHNLIERVIKGTCSIS